jgi:hypothetical protein
LRQHIKLAQYPNDTVYHNRRIRELFTQLDLLLNNSGKMPYYWTAPAKELSQAEQNWVRTRASELVGDEPTPVVREDTALKRYKVILTREQETAFIVEAKDSEDAIVKAYEAEEYTTDSDWHQVGIVDVKETQDMSH